MKSICYRIAHAAALFSILAISFPLSSVARASGAEQQGEEITIEDVVSMHHFIHESLFQTEFDEDNWVYPIAGDYWGEGIYTGAKPDGQTYDIAVIESIYIVDEDFADPFGGIYSVIAIVYSDIGVVHLHGYIAQKLIDGVLETALLPSQPLDPDSPMFWEDGGLGGGWVAASASVSPQSDAIAGDLEQAKPDCDARLARDLQVCKDQYDNTVANCHSTYDQLVQNAHDSYRGCMRWCGPVFLTCLAACVAGTSGWGAFFCYAACTTVALACDNNCSSNLTTALENAKAIRDNCLDNAEINRNACEQQANNRHADCLQDSGSPSSAIQNNAYSHPRH